jgi:hypothetical protein
MAILMLMTGQSRIMGKFHDYGLAAVAGLDLDDRDGGLRCRYAGGLDGIAPVARRAGLSGPELYGEACARFSMSERDLSSRGCVGTGNAPWFKGRQRWLKQQRSWTIYFTTP